jgi:FkbM family methyltransferase
MRLRPMSPRRIATLLERIRRPHRVTHPLPVTADELAIPTVEALDETALDAFEPHSGKGESGFLIDFLGGRTRVAYLKGYEHFDGTVLGTPDRESPVLHEHDEWLGALTSVLEARRRDALVAIELGAGWGPWLVACALAAARLGIRTVHLVGVEATTSHHAMMLNHFRDNGLDPEAHELLVGAVGDAHGVVRFPRLPDPAADWGATELTLMDGELVDKLGRRFEEFEEVPCYTITDLVGRFPAVDLLHIDIQGTEATAVPTAMQTLTDRVRRVVVGTHGLKLDRDISEAFGSAGWVVEAQRPSMLTPAGALLRDGVQVWRNDRLAQRSGGRLEVAPTSMQTESGARTCVGWLKISVERPRQCHGGQTSGRSSRGRAAPAACMPWRSGRRSRFRHLPRLCTAAPQTTLRLVSRAVPNLRIDALAAGLDPLLTIVDHRRPRWHRRDLDSAAAAPTRLRLRRRPAGVRTAHG